MAELLIEKRIRWAGGLVGLGIAVQIGSLLWNHPLAFMAFILIGSPMVVAGVLLYLYSLVHKDALAEGRTKAGSR
ncbi:MAG TPA: hypothetical protein VFY29_03745 [Terriglobia bacterium]|nr:hypothetical protein [Terriglobia bacterium]